MKEIEDLVTDQHIIQLRQVGQNKLNSDQVIQEEEDGIEAKIQAEMGEKIGFGFFIAAEKKATMEQDIRKKYALMQKMVHFKKNIQKQVIDKTAKIKSDNFNYADSLVQFQNE